MKTIERLKGRFISKDYYISVYSNHIYIINYLNIVDFTYKKVIINFSNFRLIVHGDKFKLVRKTKDELDILGSFSKMEIDNE